MNNSHFNKKINEYSPFSNLPGVILERRAIVKTISGISVTMLIYMLLSNNLLTALHTVLGFVGIDFNDGSSASQIIQQICFLLSYVMTYILPALTLYFILTYNYKFSKMFRIPNKSILAYSIPITMSVGVIFSVIINLVQSIFGAFGVYILESANVIPTNLVAYIIYLLCSTVVPAVLEEIYFHGVILYGLRRHGDSFAILVSSIMFAMAHKSIFNAMYAFILCLAIGYFVIRTGSLITGIVLHFFNNCLALITNNIEGASINQMSTAFIYIIILVLGSICIIFLVNRDQNIFSLYDKKTNFSNSNKMRYACGNIFFILVVTIFILDIALSFTIV